MLSERRGKTYCLITERILNICENGIFVRLSLKTSLPLIVYNFEKMSQLVLSTNRHYSSHTKSHAELIVFIHILIIVFGLQKKSLLLDNFLMQKLNNHLFLVTFFATHFLHRCTVVSSFLFLIPRVIIK